MAFTVNAQTLKEKQPLLLAGLVGLLVLYCDVQFVLGPWMRAIAHKQPQVAKLRRDIKQMEQDFAQQAVLQRRVADLQTQYGRYSKQLLSEQEIPQLYKLLGEMAKQSNVKIVSINRKEDAARLGGKGPAKPGAGFLSVIPIEIKARAGYYPTLQLLEQLERSGLLIEVSDLAVKGDAQNTVQHDVTLKLAMYALKEGVQK